MMDQTITPPEGLVQRLQDLEPLEAIRKAYRAGADWELGECGGWLKDQGYHPEVPRDLIAARRPTLKAQALEALKHAEEGWRPVP